MIKIYKGKKWQGKSRILWKRFEKDETDLKREPGNERYRHWICKQNGWASQQIRHSWINWKTDLRKLIRMQHSVKGWEHLRERLRQMMKWYGTRLSDFTVTFHFHALEKEMATHSSVLAWGAWWAAVYRVAQSRTWLKRLSSNIQQTEVVEEKNQNEWARNNICNIQRNNEWKFLGLKIGLNLQTEEADWTLGGMNKSQSTQEEREHSCTVAESIHWCSHCGKKHAVFLKN